jgi:hypothetical protein
MTKNLKIRSIITLYKILILNNLTPIETVILDYIETLNLHVDSPIDSSGRYQLHVLQTKKSA